MGYRPHHRMLEPIFEQEKLDLGHLDNGEPAYQNRVDLELYNTYPVYARKDLADVLALENPRVSQLQFIGTNLPNEWPYPIPREPVGSLQVIPDKSEESKALFGRSTLKGKAFKWNDKAVFDADERFGASHDFSQPTKPLITTY